MNFITHDYISQMTSIFHYFQIAQLLIDAGQELDIHTVGRYWYQYTGTALKLATERGALPYVDVLLNGGSDPDIYGK